MKKLLLLIIVLITPILSIGQPLFSGEEWRIYSYESVENKFIEMSIPASILQKNGFAMDSNGKLKKLDKTKIGNWSGNFKILPIATIKNQKYLPVERFGSVCYLSLKGVDYLHMMQNWNAYDALLDMMKKQYAYMKSPVPGKLDLGEPAFHGKAHMIDWRSHSHADGDVVFSFTANNTNRIHSLSIMLFFKSQFLDELEVYAIKEEAEAQRRRDSIAAVEQRRRDSLEDGRVHAFKLDRSVATIEAKTNDTVYLYDALRGYYKGSDFELPSSVQLLFPIMLTEEHQYKTYSEYKQYISRRGDAGMEKRIQVARTADSIHVFQNFAREQAYLDSLLGELNKAIKLLTQRQTFIIEKEYASEGYGSVGLRLRFFNYFNKTIKYVEFETRPYNQVGDVQSDAVGRRSAKGRCIGPIEPKDMGEYEFDDLYYNSNDVIARIVVTKLTITFMDNTKTTITDVNNHIGAGVYNKTM
jgi:hypothetical protein